MSSRKKRSPEEQARREKIRELLQSSGVSSMEDIRNLFRKPLPNSWKMAWMWSWMTNLVTASMSPTRI